MCILWTTFVVKTDIMLLTSMEEIMRPNCILLHLVPKLKKFFKSTNSLLTELHCLQTNLIGELCLGTQHILVHQPKCVAYGLRTNQVINKKNSDM